MRNKAAIGVVPRCWSLLLRQLGTLSLDVIDVKCCWIVTV